jgi:hypothetical protein
MWCMVSSVCHDKFTGILGVKGLNCIYSKM